MALLLFILAVVLIIIIKIVIEVEVEDERESYLCIPAFLIIIAIVMFFFNVSTLVNAKYLDEKIAMFEEENAEIETQIDELVKNYMVFEKSTFKDLNKESAITLVSLYPELKSDALVQTEIDTYVANNDKIRKLKSKKIDSQKAKWWLYFG